MCHPVPRWRHNTRKKPSFSLSVSQPYSFWSISFIRNHRGPPTTPHRYSHPFQVAGRWGPKRRFCLTTSGLITREAATSEHCVESRRHTGKESALYLGSSNNNPTTPTPTSTSLPPNMNGLWEASAVGTPGLNGEEKEKRRANTRVVYKHHHARSRRLSNMMPDVKF